MKCYNHHDRDAFAVCKSCGKGLCLECAKEYKGQLVCADSEKCRIIADAACRDIFTDKFTKYAYLFFGILLLSFGVCKTVISFVLPFPFGFSLETLLIFLISYLLIRAGVRARVKNK